MTGLSRYFRSKGPEGLSYDVTLFESLLYGTRRYEDGALVTSEDAIADVLGDHYLERVDGDGFSEEERETLADGMLSAAADHAERFGREVFSRIYGDPSKLQSPIERWAYAAHDVIDQVPEFESLRESVAGDPDLAALAASSILEVVAQRLPDLLKATEANQDPQGDDQDPDQGDDDGEDPGGSQGGAGDDKGEGEGQGSSEAGDGQDDPSEGEGDGDPQDGEGQGDPELTEEEQEAQEAMRKAVRLAARQANQDVNEAKSVLGGVAPGLADVPPAHTQETANRLRMIESLMADDRLKTVIRMAGRIVAINERVRKSESPEGSTDIVGVEVGGDLPRVLPSELLGLVADDEIFELHTLAKIAGRRAFQYETKGQEEVGRGPFTVLVDRSGSMDAYARGDSEGMRDGLRPIDWAIAIAVAAVGIGHRQKREVQIAGFDGEISSAWKIPTKGVYQRQERSDYRGTKPWEPRPEVSQKDAVLDILGWDASGGSTNFDRALGWALDEGVVRDRADILFVTDGQDYVGQHMLSRLAEAREAGLRIWGLTLNGGSVEDSLREICDDLIDLDSVDDLGKAIGSLGIGRS